MAERMGGMFFLYKMCEQSIRDDCFSAEEQHNIEKAIQSYIDESPDFRERYAKTQSGCAEKIFYDYYFKFIELAVTSEDKKNFSEFIKYASSIHDANKMAIGDMKTMFKIFKDKMQLSQLEIRLLSNLEKLTSETSLISQDGKVILNHLRIKPGKKNPWKMHLDKGRLHFTANVPKKDAKNVHEMLSDYWKEYCKNDDIKPIFAENTIEIILPKDIDQMNRALIHLDQILNEKNIILFNNERGLIETEILLEHPEHSKLLHVDVAEQSEKGKERRKEPEGGFASSQEKEREQVLSSSSMSPSQYASSFFSHQDEKRRSGSDTLTDVYTQKELNAIIEPLISYLISSTTKLIDSEKGDAKLKLTKTCIADILNSHLSREEIFKHLNTLEMRNQKIDGNKSSNLKRALATSNEVVIRLNPPVKDVSHGLK